MQELSKLCPEVPCRGLKENKMMAIKHVPLEILMMIIEILKFSDAVQFYEALRFRKNWLISINYVSDISESHFGTI